MVASGMNMLWASQIVKLRLEPTTLSQLSTIFNQLNAHIGSVTTFGEIYWNKIAKLWPNF